MPYCSNCGTLAHDRDLFCGKCGVRQPNAPPRPQTFADPFDTLTPRTASILCYIPVVGWIAAVIVLAARKFRTNHTVRFHAFQGLYLFAVWLFIDWGVRPMFRDYADPVFRVDRVLEALLMGVWIFMLVKTSHEEVYVLPVIGELAQRSATEH